jgi:undecaprenyl-diphosphatase
MTPALRLRTQLLALDELALRWASRRRTPILDQAMQALTRAGDWETWTLLVAAGFLAGAPTRTLSLKLLPALLGTFLLCRLLKVLSRRPRPSETLRDFKALLKNPDPYSFPSAHTACAVAASFVLGSELGFAPVWLGYASLIAYSRIHVGAHYPLDVLAGAGIGAGCGALALLS